MHAGWKMLIKVHAKGQRRGGGVRGEGVASLPPASLPPASPCQPLARTPALASSISFPRRRRPGCLLPLPEPLAAALPQARGQHGCRRGWCSCSLLQGSIVSLLDWMTLQEVNHIVKVWEFDDLQGRKTVRWVCLKAGEDHVHHLLRERWQPGLQCENLVRPGLIGALIQSLILHHQPFLGL